MTRSTTARSAAAGPAPARTTAARTVAVRSTTAEADRTSKRPGPARPVRRTRPGRFAALLATATAVAALAGCAGGSGEPATTGNAPTSATASAQAHNTADVTFAGGMIPHHRQAVEMVDLAPDRSASRQVRQLAEEIRKAQEPEIRTLSKWLASWGEPVPAADASHGDHSGHGMAGMMSAQEMTALDKASGAAFDRAFLRLMIKHHEGAVEMARTERSEGSYAPARRMAADIIDSQSAEITRMRKLLGDG